ncbi:MAG: transposase [Acidimicrobiales bacterium]
MRERAVRMVMNNRQDYPSEWAAFTAISKLFGMSPETLRTWVRKTQVDTGSRPGITSDERAQLKQLQREVKDLRGANAILKDASIFLSEKSSTVKPRGSSLHRHPKGSMGSRADLQSIAVLSPPTTPPRRARPPHARCVTRS